MRKEQSTILPLALSVVAGVSLGAAFLFPTSIASVILGWTSLVLIVSIPILYRARSLVLLFISGVIANFIGFYWLYSTVKEFGGFNTIASAAIFTLFITASSLQFVLFGALFRSLSSLVSNYGLTAALAWIPTEYFPYRIFPWELSHTQIHFTPFIQIADIGGSHLISFLMLWLVESQFRVMVRRERSVALFVPPLLFLLAMYYGSLRISEFSVSTAPTIDVSVVQANISVIEKHNIKLFAQNTERYAELSKDLVAPNRLVVWPETVIQEWIPVAVKNIENNSLLRRILSSGAYLVGALTFDTQRRMFNSALAIQSDGTVLVPYHKQILMPFGEYLPFEKVFPWLRDLVPTAGDFSSGNEVAAFPYRLCDLDGNCIMARVAPLICYEDLIPGLAREATRQGANLLVNLTNDAWFGDTIAPYQHHAVAVLRAVENRRFLVRSTNSGLTAIVNPIGETTKVLTPFTDNVLTDKVNLVSSITIFTRYGEVVWLLLSALTVVFGLFRLIRR